MRKKDLLALPVAEPDPLPADGRIIKYVACCRLHELKGEKVLSIDVYDATCSTVLHRVFMSRMKYLTASFDQPERACQWRTAKMCGFLLEYIVLHGFVNPMTDRPSKAAVEAFLGHEVADPFAALMEYQDDLEAVRRRMRHQQEMDGIRALMDGAKPLPDDFIIWADTEAMKHSQYMFYRRKGRKQTGFCSVCTRSSDMERLRHRRLCTCPKCGARLTAIADGMMRNGRIEDYGYASYAQSLGGDVMLRIFCIRRILTREEDGWRVETRHREFIRDIIRPVGYKTYIAGYYHHDTDNGYGFVPGGQYQYTVYPKSLLYPSGVREELAGTFARYSGLECMAKHGEPFRADLLLLFYQKHPQAEMLARRGAYRFLVELSGNWYPHSDVDMETIRRHFKDLNDGDMDAVRIWRKVDESKFPATAADVAEWGRRKDYHLATLLRYAPLNKINSYIVKVATSKGFHDVALIVQYLADYWVNADKCGMDMNDKRVLFPENLRAAHDKAAAEYKLFKSQKVEDALTKRFEQLSGRYHFEAFGCLVVVPSCTNDFIIESQTLCHCVRTYAERAAFGETTILFVRNEQAPGTPFYTMEVRDNRVIQLRGKNNCAPTDEVLKFEDAFCKQYGLQKHIA